MLRVDPADPSAPQRDRFILSKGHCAAALYSTLALRGFFPVEELETFIAAALGAERPPEPAQGAGRRDEHRAARPRSADRRRDRDRRASSPRRDWRTFVVLGDGELQEGSNWEAAMCAGHRELDNLVAIVDRNRLQQGARTEDTNRLEPLGDKWRAFGWDVVEVDGHDHAALYDAFAVARTRQAALRDRQHHQGQGRLVHRGSRRVAPQGADSPEQVELALKELA